MKDKEFELSTENFISSKSIFPNYDLNVEKIKNIEDIKLIFKHMKLGFSPQSKEDYEEMKHLLIIN